MKKLVILGCTGSIGGTAVSLLREYPGLVKVVGMSAFSNTSLLLSLAEEFKCGLYASPAIKGHDDILSMIRESGADLVLNGISGAAGLAATFTALECGCDVALANKESMVMAGDILNALAKRNGCRIIPVDSEHSAIYELEKAFGKESIDKLIITASGGPFRGKTREELEHVTAEQAAAHPNWKMGIKISIDCATMANKALEVIEAGRLFGVPAARIKTVLHPQSRVHSMVSLKNGQTYAQMSLPSMRFPILNAIFDDLGLEIEKPLEMPLFDLGEDVHLDFLPMDFDRFPLVGCGFRCLEQGGAMPIVFNAANEVAVDAFRNGLIRFTQIEDVVLRTVETASLPAPAGIGEVYESDMAARELASGFIKA